MIQHTVTFTLPDDQVELDLHLAGPALLNAVIEFRRWVRDLIKHDELITLDGPTVQALYDRLLEELKDVPEEVL
jgi:hypothetical protein